MGAVDLVLMVESPGAVARGLQRVGRAGHGVGETSRGRLYPKHRGDLLEATVVCRGMRRGAVEALRVPRNPLDVLAQQIVAMCAVEAGPWRRWSAWCGARRATASSRTTRCGGARHALRPLPVDGLRRAAPAPGLGPRGATGSRRAAAPASWRCSRAARSPTAGSTASTWAPTARGSASSTRRWSTRRASARPSRSAPAPGACSRSPAIGCWWRRRPARSGAAVLARRGPRAPARAGPRARRLPARARRPRAAPDDAEAWLRAEWGLDAFAARNLRDHVAEQRAATGTLPTDRALTVERFRDELGDWRVCILSPLGRAPARALGAGARGALSQEAGYEVQALWSDDGIALRFADAERPPDLALLLPEPEEIEELVLAQLGHSALFAAAVPRERGARAAAAAPPPGRTHAALGAAPASAEPARRGARLPELPDRARDLPHLPAGRLRPPGPRRPAAAGARPRDPRGRGGDAVRLALRARAGLRLHRRVPVPGRLARRRAPRPGADARPQHAARPARRGAPAGAARRRR
jgi:ATP-dependent helicase Lhr and Lhr-like helicase